MPSYKITYFDVRGRAELSRIILTYSKQKFEDIRLSGEEFAAKKKDLPYGQLPILEFDGKVLAQSNAITRFLARECKLVGKTSFDEAKCDEYIELLEDMFKEVAKTYFEKDEAKKAEMLKELEETKLPRFIDLIERDLAKNGGKYLVGASLTVADLAVLCAFDAPCKIFPKLLDSKKAIREYREQLAKLPELADYLKNRKDTVV